MKMVYNGQEVVTRDDIKSALGITDSRSLRQLCKKHNWEPAHTVLSGKALEQFKGIYPNVTKSWHIGLYPIEEYDKAVSLAGIIADPAQVRGETMAKNLCNLSFESESFGNLRAVTDDNGNPWFVGKDVAVALGYVEPKNAIAKHVHDDDKVVGVQNTPPSQSLDTSRFFVIDSLGRKQYPVFISESGMYALIFGSKLPCAINFKHWVTSEVLPSIRKTGGYRDVDRMQSQLDSMKTTIDRIERTTKNMWMAMGISARATNAMIKEY